MPKTYLFYDLETSGLSKCFDQVLQFAAIRTDLQFNELERHEIIIRLNPDVLPNPYATITHRIGIADCANGDNELAAMEKIHALLNTPGTISLGYNTLTFDDEFLRFSFYRNLLTPYTHQYANQCQRMDVYPMTVLYHLYKPEVLQWPEKDGRPVMKLEAISELNKLATGQAHNAIVDVEATVALAKKLAQEPKMWDFITGYFDKRMDLTRSQNLPIAFETPTHQHHEALMVMGKIGARYHYQAPVLSLGGHAHYKNQSLWLRLDLPELQQTTLDNLDEKTWVFNKKMGEPGLLLPFTPHYSAKMKDSRTEQTQSNTQWLQDHPEILAAIIDYHSHYKHPVEPHTDVDANLYNSDFWSNQEQRQCQQFHQADWSQKANHIDSFENPVLKDMAIRAVGRAQPEALSAPQREQFDAYLKTVWDPAHPVIDYTGKSRYDSTQAKIDLAGIAENKTLDAQQQTLLDEYRQVFKASLHVT